MLSQEERRHQATRAGADPEGLFRIEYPAGWQVRPQTAPGRTAFYLDDPDEGVAVTVQAQGSVPGRVEGSALTPAVFIAKKEVASWPFFGTLARLQETVFVEREKRSQTVAARDEIRDRLREGDALVLFPEGTSDDGNRVLPFRSALLGAAEMEIGTDAHGQVHHVPVQPVSVTYVGVHGIPMGRENRPLFAWYGDMELIPHLWEAVKTGPMDAVVEFHLPMTVDTAGGRKALAAAAEAMVRAGQARALAGLYVDGHRALVPQGPQPAPELAHAAA